MARERKLVRPRDASVSRSGAPASTIPPHATKDQLTDRLLNAATEVFLEKGFSASTSDEMAVRAKAGNITFYKHFGNKQALFEAIILRVNKTIFQGFVAALEANTPVRRALTLFLQRLADVFHDEDAVRLVRVLQAESERFPRLAEVFDKDGPRKSHAMLQKFLLQRMQAGELRRSNASIAAEQLVHMATGERSRRTLLGLSPSLSRKESEARIAASIDTFMRAYGR